MVIRIMGGIGVAVMLLWGTLACTHAGNEKRNLLARQWVYQEFKTNYDRATGEQLGSPIMEFNKDGSYRIIMGPVSLALGLQSDEGTWYLKRNSLVLKSNLRGEHQFDLQKLSADTLMLHSKLDSVDLEVTITLVPLTTPTAE
ncbi:MAG: hypothetical protein KatS3mg031_0682 [Chitinophagales bacterium]|nr:MAG: hypothetical protein KatS3mg031_0682 [Chitinophagales bacterium]